jgi:hypothetical protein
MIADAREAHVGSHSADTIKLNFIRCGRLDMLRNDYLRLLLRGLSPSAPHLRSPPDCPSVSMRTCSDRVAPFELCVRAPKLISARRTSSRNFWRSIYCFAMTASKSLRTLLVGVNFGLFKTTSALPRTWTAESVCCGHSGENYVKWSK